MQGSMGRGRGAHQGKVAGQAGQRSKSAANTAPRGAASAPREANGAWLSLESNLNRSARQAFDSTVTRLSRGGGDDDEYDDEAHIPERTSRAFGCKSEPCFDEEKAHHAIPGEACGCATALAARLTTLSPCRKNLKLTTSPLCTEAARLTTTSIRCRHPTNAATYPRTISSSDGRKSVPRQQLWPGRRRDCSSERSKDYR